ncbi:hypothetical protein HDU85_004769, partial [Gaertneriomyces sp. JEL0708]
MGLYWATLLYYGRMCSPEAHQRILKSGLPHEGFLIEIAKDRWVLHAPGRFVTMGSIDRILEAHEKRDRRVSLTEAMDWLSEDEEKPDWDGVSQSDLAHLEALVKAAAAEDEKNTAPNVYICEVSWSTLEMPADAGQRVTYNIRC